MDSRETPAAYRQRLAAVIVGALRDDETIRAVGEGGAAARGRADQFSDLDLVIVAPLKHADAIFGRVETAIGPPLGDPAALHLAHLSQSITSWHRRMREGW